MGKFGQRPRPIKPPTDPSAMSLLGMVPPERPPPVINSAPPPASRPIPPTGPAAASGNQVSTGRSGRNVLLACSYTDYDAGQSASTSNSAKEEEAESIPSQTTLMGLHSISYCCLLIACSFLLPPPFLSFFPF
jgi:hypothetical protein